MVKVLMQPSGEKVDLVDKIRRVIMVQNITVVEEVLLPKLEHDQVVEEDYAGRIAFQ